MLATSRNDEVALNTKGGLGRWWYSRYGPLAVVPRSGGAPRDLLEDVCAADWSPDGRTLAVVRRVSGEDRLEMPPGRVLVKTSGWLGDVRVSPDGRRIACTKHPVLTDERGWVAVVDRTGRETRLTTEFANVSGLAWSRAGREVWFSASSAGNRQRLLAVTLNGGLRTVVQLPASVVLADVAADGRALLVSLRLHRGIRGKSPSDDRERELGWLDLPWPDALSADGRKLLLEDQGETSGPNYTVYLRNMDGSPPVRLGEGSGCALSPDGRSALTVHYGPPHRLVLIPTGAGDTLSLPRGRVETYQQSASWLPDARRVVFVGAERGRPQRAWIQELPRGLPRPVTPEGIAGGLATDPDGKWVAAVTPDSMLTLFSLETGSPRRVAKLAPDQEVVQWSADGRTLFVSRGGAAAGSGGRGCRDRKDEVVEDDRGPRPRRRPSRHDPHDTRCTQLRVWLHAWQW